MTTLPTPTPSDDDIDRAAKGRNPFSYPVEGGIEDCERVTPTTPGGRRWRLVKPLRGNLRTAEG
jgi:hypothetical protein